MCGADPALLSVPIQGWCYVADNFTVSLVSVEPGCVAIRVDRVCACVWSLCDKVEHDPR